MEPSTISESRRYGRGTGIPDPVDVHVGARIRARRLFIGMNQEEPARALDLTFQQVQKYEGGANRVSASRLHEIAEALRVSIDYFYADFDPDGEGQTTRDLLQRPEAIDLIRFYCAIADPDIRHEFKGMVEAVARSEESRA
jgi:transcriptional regulator with XRE-family HTH domain